MKRLVVASLLILTGCSESDAPTATTPPSIEMRVAAITATGTPWHDMWVRFEDRMRAIDPPGLELQMHVFGQLGSEEATLSNLRRGRIQVGGYSLQGAASVVPELSVILAPYLFESRQEVDFIMDHHLYALFNELFAEKGLVLIQWAEVGWTHIYGREPILTPDDVRSIAFRSSTAHGARIFGQAIGTDLISIPFPEVVPALQTGLIAAGQSGVGIYALTGIAQEAPHLTLTAHAFDTGVVLAHKAWFDGLPESVRQAFRESLDEVQFSRNDVRAALDQIRREVLPQRGVTVHELTDQEREAWRLAVAGSHQDLIEAVGGRAQEVYEQIQAGKLAFAAE